MLFSKSQKGVLLYNIQNASATSHYQCFGQDIQNYFIAVICTCILDKCEIFINSHNILYGVCILDQGYCLKQQETMRQLTSELSQIFEIDENLA